MEKDNIVITINLTTSALVTRSQKGFVVQQLENGQTQFVSDSSLVNFQKSEEFIAEFSKPFKTTNILLSTDANLQMTAMLQSAKETGNIDNLPSSSQDLIPYFVVDLNSTLLVTRCGKSGFEVELLSTGKDKYIPVSELFGNYFKYPSDFARKFAEHLCSASTGTIILSIEANAYMLSILAFNRIDC